MSFLFIIQLQSINGKIFPNLWQRHLEITSIKYIHLSLFDDLLSHVSDFHSFFQKVNVFMSSVNSAANPFLYFAFMPTFRRSIKKTFLPCLGANVAPEDQGDTNTTPVSY